jgi:hypothetical protein
LFQSDSIPNKFNQLHPLAIHVSHGSVLVARPESELRVHEKRRLVSTSFLDRLFPLGNLSPLSLEQANATASTSSEALLFGPGIIFCLFRTTESTPNDTISRSLKIHISSNPTKAHRTNTVCSTPDLSQVCPSTVAFIHVR